MAVIDPSVLDELKPSPAGRGVVAAWLGILCPPVAFLGEVGLGYSFCYLECATERRWLVPVTVVTALLGVAMAAGLARAARGEASHPHPPLALSMLWRLGDWSAALFAVAVVAGAIPLLFLGPCQHY